MTRLLRSQGRVLVRHCGGARWCCPSAGLPAPWMCQIGCIEQFSGHIVGWCVDRSRYVVSNGYVPGIAARRAWPAAIASPLESGWVLCLGEPDAPLGATKPRDPSHRGAVRSTESDEDLGPFRRRRGGEGKACDQLPVRVPEASAAQPRSGAALSRGYTSVGHSFGRRGLVRDGRVPRMHVVEFSRPYGWQSVGVVDQLRVVLDTRAI